MRRELKEVISSCNECKLQRTRPMPPIMAPFPEDRLEAEKRWVALFTCLTTRAIHLELAHDLSTDSCIIAIRNFVCRRGPVHRLRSDNDKNFVELTGRPDDLETCSRRRAYRVNYPAGALNKSFFNCSSNPSEGGVWERMVQCVKRVLRHTLKEVAPRDHVLESFLIEAENVVNSLVRHEKWCRRTEPIRQGDMVFVCDPTLTSWRKSTAEMMESSDAPVCA
ncbi:uncharacterized protein [Drosophila kikkawai]|uniref:Integrase catalytic domain-containing protein n=1 Tax=Drosophila kikkawai TaxID=30033 RepID=A0ABM4GH57_DROKI